MSPISIIPYHHIPRMRASNRRGRLGLGLLRELVPTAALMAVLLNPNSSMTTDQMKDVQEAARAVGQQIHILHASSERELDTAFETLGALRPGALLVGFPPLPLENSIK